MNLFLKIVLAAALGAAMLGGAVLIAGNRSSTPSPTPSPTTSVTPATPAPSFAVTPLPATMIGNWVADVGDVAGLGNSDPRIRLVTANDGSALWLLTNTFDNQAMRSVPIVVTDDGVHVASAEAGVGCAIGDEGAYRTTVSPDGLQLTFEAVDDACATRSEALARTWVRAVDFASKGGLGAIAAFDPVFTIELPAGRYTGTPEMNAAAEVSSTDRTLVAVKDPWGLAKPCSSDPASNDKAPVDPNADAFVDYLRTLPGRHGRPRGADDRRPSRRSRDDLDRCGDRLSVGRARDVDPEGVHLADPSWGVTPGDPASVYLAEVGSDLVLLQWRGDGVTTQEERDVLSTITFLDGLPAAP